MAESKIPDLVVRKSSHDAPIVGGNDVFPLAVRCKARADIHDFRTSVARRRPRYSTMIAPSWAQGRTESQLWPSSAMLYPALTGDPWAVYCSGEIESIQFD